MVLFLGSTLLITSLRIKPLDTGWYYLLASVVYLTGTESSIIFPTLFY